MSSIADALKRAQAERERLKPMQGAGASATAKVAAAGAAQEASLASVVLRRGGGRAPSGALMEGVEAVKAAAPPIPAMPLTRALTQNPSAPAPQGPEARAVETIVEDYAAKRGLNLPDAVVMYHERGGAIAAQYRKVRDRLIAGNTARERQALVVTSTRSGEGKTITVLNLALALVELPATRVLVIDGRLHGGEKVKSLSDYLHLDSVRGLAEFLAEPIPSSSSLGGPVFDPATIEPYLRATPWHHLYVLPCGARTTKAAAGELLQASSLRGAMRHLRANFDWILIDAPAAGGREGPDAGILGALSDGVLFALALHHTSRVEAQATLRRLQAINLPLRGCILTRE